MFVGNHGPVAKYISRRKTESCLQVTMVQWQNILRDMRLNHVCKYL